MPATKAETGPIGERALIDGRTTLAGVEVAKWSKLARHRPLVKWVRHPQSERQRSDFSKLNMSNEKGPGQHPTPAQTQIACNISIINAFAVNGRSPLVSQSIEAPILSKFWRVAEGGSELERSMVGRHCL
jgi:hypothetical protein